MGKMVITTVSLSASREPLKKNKYQLSGMTHKKWHFVLRCSGLESRGETVFVQCLMGVSIVGMFVVQEREES